MTSCSITRKHAICSDIYCYQDMNNNRSGHIAQLSEQSVCAPLCVAHTHTHTRLHTFSTLTWCCILETLQGGWWTKFRQELTPPHAVFIKFLISDTQRLTWEAALILKEGWQAQGDAAGGKVGQPKEKQKDSVRRDPHQETWAARWGGTILNPEERTKHTVHVTKDTLLNKVSGPTSLKPTETL